VVRLRILEPIANDSARAKDAWPIAAERERGSPVTSGALLCTSTGMCTSGCALIFFLVLQSSLLLLAVLVCLSVPAAAYGQDDHGQQWDTEGDITLQPPGPGPPHPPGPGPPHPPGPPGPPGPPRGKSLPPS